MVKDIASIEEICINLGRMDYRLSRAGDEIDVVFLPDYGLGLSGIDTGIDFRPSADVVSLDFFDGSGARG